MPSFKKNLIADCLIDDVSADAQVFVLADEDAVTCEGFETRINDLLDDRGDLPSDPALQVHADGCSSCRQTLRQYEQLELLLGGERKGLVDAAVERRSDVDVEIGPRESRRWLQLSTTVALLALLVVTGQYVTDHKNVGVGTEVEVPQVAVAASESPTSSAVLESVESTEVEALSPVALALIEDVSWSQEGSVGQLLVDSGSEWLAGRREQQAAVIQGLSDVRLDLNLVQARLTSLQPVLTYSGRIPALSPMQGTLCFTLGWLRKGKVADQPKMLPDERRQTGFEKSVRHVVNV